MPTQKSKVVSIIAAATVAVLGATSADLASAGNLKLRTSGAAGIGGAAIGGIAIPFSPTCAAGFSKVGEKGMKKPTGTDWFVCSTPVITCPVQHMDGKRAGVNAQAIIQETGGDPDGGTIKFRVQYMCDYTAPYVPVG